NALPSGPLWLFAATSYQGALLAQVAVPFDRTPGSPGSPGDGSSPPRLFALSKAGEQNAGLGSYCWRNFCADAIGIPLPAGPLQVKPGELLGLRSQYGPDPASGL